ncbi:MAG: hypothetical protein A2074_03220 [Candidatus Aquicultor primus]|uniref:Uncharacterized protein n=1 Tax=Candidatus Aquicultor primus TaxID=1797195 RepID=A0A1F2UJ05_9ACTN|nr:MAG: hypothetical protein A2074_03220 [Candidatus Aquicultor primus]HCG99885.1 hypothetical protein [Actinomycetota bacterium]
MLISTIIFMDGEERQFRAEKVRVGEAGVDYVRVDLDEEGEVIIPLTAIKEIHTTDLSEDDVAADLLG